MVPEKKGFSSVVEIHSLVDGWSDAGVKTSGNKTIDSIRKTAHERIGSTKLESVTNLFGEKYRDYFSDFEKISMVKLCLKNIEEKNIGEIDQVAGQKILGKITISGGETKYWIDPDVQNQGVVLCDIKRAIQDHSDHMELAFKTHSINRETVLSNMILSQTGCGAFLYVPNNTSLDGPIIFEIILPAAQDSLSLCHMVTILGSAAKAKLVFDITSENDSDCTSILAVQNDTVLGDDSELKIIQNQNAGNGSAVFISERIAEGKNAVLNDFILDKGGAILDRFISVDQVIEGSEAQITALYQETDDQRYFYDTHQLQLASHTVSDLLFKGVLRKNSYSNWKGNILVAKDTAGSNGYQANNILLLDESSKAESIPGLEILTDDVKCSHGVTMGNIDKNQMFYLQSRGINKDDAENLIVNGFLLSAVKRLKDQDLEDYVQTLLDT